VSYSKGERSTSKQTQRHHIMEVSDLASMPPGRAVVFPSGIPATMIKTVPWMIGPYAGAVRASLAHHDPGASGPASVGAWIAAGRDQVLAPRPQCGYEAPPASVPVWVESEERRRGW
jgi:hypothetical protein